MNELSDEGGGQTTYYVLRRKQLGAFLTHPRKHKIEARLLLQSHENSTVQTALLVQLSLGRGGV